MSCLNSNLLKSPIESKQESFHNVEKNEKVEEQDDILTHLQMHATRNAVDIVCDGAQSQSYDTILLSRNIQYYYYEVECISFNSHE